MDYFWNTFLKSGSIEAYLAHKEWERLQRKDRIGKREFSHDKKR